jgi:uridine phosphorylase
MMEEVQHHIRCKKGDVARYVLLPGDPARVKIISEFFDESWKVAENREYITYTGKVDGIPISVTSTGIGCPAATIAAEELINVGAEVLIRVGTSGGIDPSIRGGEIVVAQAAIRSDGATREYITIEYPAVADIDVTNALVLGAKRAGINPKVGIVWTHDAFYRGTWRGWMPDADEVYKPWLKGGVLCVENECSGLFVVSRIRRVKAGAVLAVAGNNLSPERREDEELLKETIIKAIKTAINAVKILEKERDILP